MVCLQRHVRCGCWTTAPAMPPARVIGCHEVSIAHSSCVVDAPAADAGAPTPSAHQRRIATLAHHLPHFCPHLGPLLDAQTRGAAARQSQLRRGCADVSLK
eukprot:SAG31_NODE_22409_length_526_cov_0.967213_1_plen_100_part_01